MEKPSPKKDLVPTPKDSLTKRKSNLLEKEAVVVALHPERTAQRQRAEKVACSPWQNKALSAVLCQQRKKQFAKKRKLLWQHCIGKEQHNGKEERSKLALHDNTRLCWECLVKNRKKVI